jgi:hypothetical protein
MGSDTREQVAKGEKSEVIPRNPRARDRHKGVRLMTLLIPHSNDRLTLHKPLSTQMPCQAVQIFAATFCFTPSLLGPTEQLGPRYNDQVMSQTGPPGR